MAPGRWPPFILTRRSARGFHARARTLSTRARWRVSRADAAIVGGRASRRKDFSSHARTLSGSSAAMILELYFGETIESPRPMWCTDIRRGRENTGRPTWAILMTTPDERIRY